MEHLSTYLLIKTVHIVSSVLLAGTGLGSAFYLFFANRSGSLEARAVVCRLVVRADTWFTTPAIVVQPLTGFWMAQLAGWPLSSPWLQLSILLFVLTGACWLPVVWLQWKMSRMASAAVMGGVPLPPLYERYALLWERLGYPAFGAMLVVFYLMVNKPPLWAGAHDTEFGARMIRWGNSGMATLNLVRGGGREILLLEGAFIHP